MKVKTITNLLTLCLCTIWCTSGCSTLDIPCHIRSGIEQGINTGRQLLGDELLGNLGGVVKDTLDPVFDLIPGEVKTALNSTFRAIPNAVKTVLEPLFHHIEEMITTFSSAVTQGFIGTTNQLTGINNQIKSLQTSYGSIPNQISGVTNQVTGITSQIQAVGQSIHGVTTAISGVTNQVTSITNQMGSVSGQIGSLSDTMNQGVNGVSNQVGGITSQMGTLSSSVTQGISGVTNQVSSLTHQISGVKTQIQGLGSTTGEIMNKASDIGSNLGNVMNVAIPGLDGKLDSILGEGVPLLDGKLDGLLEIVEQLTTMAIGQGSLDDEVGAFADTLNVCFIQLLDLGDLAQAIEDITGFSLDDVPEFAANIPDPKDIVFRIIAKVFLKYKSLLDFFCTDGIRIIMELADKWLGGGILPIETGNDASRRRMGSVPAPEPNCINLAEDEFCAPDGLSGIYSYENPENTFYNGLVNGLGSATSSKPLIPDPYDNSDTNEFVKYKKVGFILYLIEEFIDNTCEAIGDILGNELLKNAIPGITCAAIKQGLGYANKILAMTEGAVDIHDGDITNVRLKAVFRDRITIIHNQKMLSKELEILTERINSEFNFSTTNVNDRFDLHLIKLEKETKDLTNRVDEEFDESTTNINNKIQILTTNINNKFDTLTQTIDNEFIDSTTNINNKFNILTDRVDEEFTTSTININNKFNILTQQVDNEFTTSTTNINTQFNELTDRVNNEFNISSIIIREIHDLQMTALQQGFVDLVGSPQGAEYTLTKIKESLDTVENKLENRLDALTQKIDDEFTQSTTNINDKVDASTVNVNNELDALTQRVNEEFSASTTNVNERFETLTQKVDQDFKAQLTALQQGIIGIVGTEANTDYTLTTIKDTLDDFIKLWVAKFGPKPKAAQGKSQVIDGNVIEDESKGFIVLKIRPTDFYVFVGMAMGFYVLSIVLGVVVMTRCVNNRDSRSKRGYVTTDVEDAKQ